MYLNAYVPKLTSAAGIAWFVRKHLGYRFASTKQVCEMTVRFVERIRRFASEEGIEMVRFEKGQRKDSVMQDRLRRFAGKEGVVFIGVAQEKARVPRTERKQMREIGFAANRRMLEVETLSHDCQVGAAALEAMQQPVKVEGQHGAALRFGDARVQALLTVLVMMSLQVEGFRNRQLRPLLAQCLGLKESDITAGRMSYDLRRLRLHGLIERIEGTHRYLPTQAGLRTAFFYSRTYACVVRPGLSIMHDDRTVEAHPMAAEMRRLEKKMDDYIMAQIAA